MNEEIYEYIKVNRNLPFKVKCDSGHQITEISFRTKFTIKISEEEEEKKSWKNQENQERMLNRKLMKSQKEK